MISVRAIVWAARACIVCGARAHDDSAAPGFQAWDIKGYDLKSPILERSLKHLDFLLRYLALHGTIKPHGV
jgi:hypothetical protein